MEPFELNRLPLLCVIVTGLLIGSGLTTFLYAEGASYLSTDPKACVNCHIMQPQYDSWQKSSHHTVATCVECHLPHDFLAKYLGKAEHGWNHSTAFTLQNFHEPIEISPRSAEQLHGNCVRCHGSFIHDQIREGEERLDCVSCHDTVGHGERAGLGGPFRPGEEHP